MVAGKSRSVIIDSSAILSHILPDESLSKKFTQIFKLYQQNKLDFIAPDLLKIEVGNTLKTAIIQKRLTLKLATQILNQFLLMPINYIKDINHPAVFKLTITHNLTFYDAIYLHLSLTNQAPLITLDKKLARLSP